jgi:hypothetical protein
MSRPERDRVWRVPATVLANPAEALSRAIARPEPWVWFATLAAAWVALGLATVPRQLDILQVALVHTGDLLLDAQSDALREGLVRLIIVDRLVPLPTALVAGLLLPLVAEPVLMLPAARRRELLAVVVLGLAPLAAERVGELVMTWATSVAPGMSAGEALQAPHRFVSGAGLFWRSSAPAPLWIELFEARLNLFTLWCGGLWSAGLRALDGPRWEAWHVLLPLACLAAAGLLTWALGPIVVPMVLRGVGG